MMRVGLLAAAVLAAAPALAADVTVTLTGVKAKGGTLRVSLYDEGTFLKPGPPFLAEAEVKTAGPVTVTFANVPAGDYAIAAVHDADNDGTMTLANGRMAEGTALSRAEELRAAPSFAATKVPVPADGARFTLPMSYPEDRTGW